MLSQRAIVAVLLFSLAGAGCLQTVPPTPGNVIAVGGDSQVDLSWLPVSDDALSLYNVYMGLSPKDLKHLLTVSRPKTQVTIPNLVNGTPYYFAVNAENVLGQRSEKSKVVSATPNPPTNAVQPSIRGTVPQEGMSGVSITSEIRIEFSEPMDIGTVRVTVEPSLALGGPQWLSNNRVLKFPLAAAFVKNTQYRITVEGKDLSGNDLTFPRTFTFLTEDVDQTPPLVVATSPYGGELYVPNSIAIQILFTEPMDPGRPSFPISFTPDFPWVEQWNPQHTLLIINPTQPLGFGVQYSFTISTEARDVAGNPLGSAYSASFTTQPLPDINPPYVTQVSPGSGQVANSNPPPIQIFFSEPMNTTLTEGNINVNSWVGTVIGIRSWNLDRTIFTFQPTSPFISGEHVTILLTEYRDVAGNSGYNFQSSFIVP